MAGKLASWGHWGSTLVTQVVSQAEKGLSWGGGVRRSKRSRGKAWGREREAGAGFVLPLPSRGASAFASRGLSVQLGKGCHTAPESLDYRG